MLFQVSRNINSTHEVVIDNGIEQELVADRSSGVLQQIQLTEAKIIFFQLDLWLNLSLSSSGVESRSADNASSTSSLVLSFSRGVFSMEVSCWVFITCVHVASWITKAKTVLNQQLKVTLLPYSPTTRLWGAKCVKTTTCIYISTCVFINQDAYI